MRFPEINAEIDKVIADISGITKTFVSKEKTNRGSFFTLQKASTRSYIQKVQLRGDELSST